MDSASNGYSNRPMRRPLMLETMKFIRADTEVLVSGNMIRALLLVKRAVI